MLSQHVTRSEVETAREDGPTTYSSVRAALRAARELDRKMRDNPGAYHYSHATGDYELVDGRTVEVRLVAATGGGVLLGVYEYAVVGRETHWEPRRWRAV